MKKINLLHLKTSANIGGAEVMLTYWPKYLDKDKFSQFAIFAEDGLFIKIMEGLGTGVLCLPDLMSIKGFAIVPKLVSFIKEKKIDIIHAHGARVNLWGSFASLLTAIPIISTEHSIDLWRNSSRVFNLVDKFSAKINKFRVGVSPAVCEMLRMNGVASEKVLCIENGIDLERFNTSIDIQAKKAEFGILNTEKVIGTVGRLVEQKGHKYLIDAFKELQSKAKDLRLLIVGDGPLRKVLEEQTKRLAIDGKVIFAGQREDIPELLKVIDIFVLPSLTEGLPLALLEAMASEKPIVASNVSGIPYVLDDKLNGFLVPPKQHSMFAETMAYLIQNPDIAKKIASAAKCKAYEKYNAKDMIKQYQLLYNKLLSR